VLLCNDKSSFHDGGWQGIPIPELDAVMVAQALKDQGVRIIVVGLEVEDPLRRDVLQAIASSPTDLHYASTPEGLFNIYGNIANQLMGATVTKNYYVNGQHIAMRIETSATIEATGGVMTSVFTGSLYYIASDHLGSTSLVVDAEGNPLTRSRYDPFGEVAETQIWQDDSWVSLDPTQAITQTDYLYLGDHLERELNIYFTADGRYYDPWLGKYLQPDAIGGPPLIPQAADRYQYAGNSPTGVGGASQGSALVLFGWMDLRDIAVDSLAFATGNAVQSAARRLGWSSWAGYGARLGRLRVPASRTLVDRLIEEGVIAEDFLEETGERSGRMIVWRTSGTLYEDSASGLSSGLENRLRNARQKGEWYPGAVTFVTSHGTYSPIAGQLAERLGLDASRLGIEPFTAAEAMQGLAIGFFFDAGWQYLQDVGNPYLTPSQRWQRAGIVGLTGVGFGALVILAVGTGPSGFVAALIVGWTVERWVADAWIEAAGLQPEMRLCPLQP
jgi:RHS repeat-associated protein